MIHYIQDFILYENPIPHVRSLHGYFPGLTRLPSGDILALFVMGEAFEAANCTTVVARSKDSGRTWALKGPLHSKSPAARPYSDSLKATVLQDGSLLAMGYCFYRDDADKPIGIAETDGILPGDDLVSFSRDQGRTWTTPTVIPRSRPELLEISGPALALRSGGLLACGAPFKTPAGENPSGPHGVLLRSENGGGTWSDSEIFFRSNHLAPLESRLCEMQDGRIVGLSWAYSYRESKSYPNHYVVSHDNGKSWSEPQDTSIRAQASGLAWLGGDHLLTIHAHREDECPGLAVRVVDLSKDRWRVVEEKRIWGGGSHNHSSATQPTTGMFRKLRFGQPSLLPLGDGEFLAAHWSIEDGQGKIRLHHLRVNL